MEPFLVITPTGYTKHYYAGTAAQIGKGNFNTVNSTIDKMDCGSSGGKQKYL